MDISSGIWLAAYGPPAARLFMQPLQTACDRFEINTEQRAAAFLAQCAHESLGFDRLEENLSYSAARIHTVWPKRFPTIESAEPFARNPKKLACKVYNGRMGNRIGTEDGWDFRGRAPLMITGRDMYKRAGQAVDLPLLDYPDLAAKPDGGSLVSAWYWFDHKLNALADLDSLDSFISITRTINGGTTGMDDRLNKWNLIRPVFGLKPINRRKT
jgi:putative chitinase